MPRTPAVRRGDVWLVSLDPTVGHEIQKTRPAVVVTANTYNDLNWLVLVVPLSSRDRAEYDQVLVEPPEGGLDKTSVTLPDQLRAVDKRRLVRRLGRVNDQTLSRIDRVLRIVLGLS